MNITRINNKDRSETTVSLKKALAAACFDEVYGPNRNVRVRDDNPHATSTMIYNAAKRYNLRELKAGRKIWTNDYVYVAVHRTAGL